MNTRIVVDLLDGGKSICDLTGFDPAKVLSGDGYKDVGSVIWRCESILRDWNTEDPAADNYLPLVDMRRLAYIWTELQKNPPGRSGLSDYVRARTMEYIQRLASPRPIDSSDQKVRANVVLFASTDLGKVRLKDFTEKMEQSVQAESNEFDPRHDSIADSGEGYTHYETRYKYMHWSRVYNGVKFNFYGLGRGYSAFDIDVSVKICFDAASLENAIDYRYGEGIYSVAAYGFNPKYATEMKKMVGRFGRFRSAPHIPILDANMSDPSVIPYFKELVFASLFVDLPRAIRVWSPYDRSKCLKKTVSKTSILVSDGYTQIGGLPEVMEDYGTIIPVRRGDRQDPGISAVGMWLPDTMETSPSFAGLDSIQFVVCPDHFLSTIGSNPDRYIIARSSLVGLQSQLDTLLRLSFTCKTFHSLIKEWFKEVKASTAPLFQVLFGLIMWDLSIKLQLQMKRIGEWGKCLPDKEKQGSGWSAAYPKNRDRSTSVSKQTGKQGQARSLAAVSGRSRSFSGYSGSWSGMAKSSLWASIRRVAVALPDDFVFGSTAR